MRVPQTRSHAAQRGSPHCQHARTVEQPHQTDRSDQVGSRRGTARPNPFKTMPFGTDRVSPFPVRVRMTLRSRGKPQRTAPSPGHKALPVSDDQDLKSTVETSSVRGSACLFRMAGLSVAVLSGSASRRAHAPRPALREQTVGSTAVLSRHAEARQACACRSLALSCLPGCSRIPCPCRAANVSADPKTDASVACAPGAMGPSACGLQDTKNP